MPVTTPLITFADTTFTKADIRSCVVTEEFNPISIVLPVSRLELTLYSNNVAFSVVNPGMDYGLLQYLQPLLVYIIVDGTQKYIGKYYLDTWENVSDTLIKLNCMDEMGILDTLTYLGGMWTTATAASSIIASMLDEINVGYDIDPIFDDVDIKGWIPICSYREALQQICFASGAFALIARQEGVIKIGTSTEVGVVTRGVRCGVPHNYGGGGVTKTATAQNRRIWQKRWRESQWSGVEPTYELGLSDQAGNPMVSLRTQVTGVEVSLHDISIGTSSRNCFEGYKAIGTYPIYFTQPMHTLSLVSGLSGVGTIIDSGANYCVLNVTGAGNFKIDGLVYNDSVTKFGVYNENTELKQNIVTIEEATMLNSTNGVTVANWVYNYFQKRHKQNLKMIAPLPNIASMVHTIAQYDKYITGTIEKTSLDLMGGYIVQAEIVGEPDPDPRDIYFGIPKIDKPIINQ